MIMIVFIEAVLVGLVVYGIVELVAFIKRKWKNKKNSKKPSTKSQ